MVKNDSEEECARCINPCLLTQRVEQKYALFKQGDVQEVLVQMYKKQPFTEN